MIRRLVPGVLALLLVLVATAVPDPPAAAGDAVSVERVSFPISFDPRDTADRAWGKLYRPRAALACSSSVLLLLHEMSYAFHQWDFPLEPERYSMARTLASAGYPTVAIDLPGHGSSGHTNGYRYTIPVYADITNQIVRQLRAGTYRTFGGEASPRFAKVALVGTGIGTETAELATGRYGGVDALVASAYTHFPSLEFTADFLRWDLLQTTGDDYTTLGAISQRRVQYMYNIDAADREVVDRDTAMQLETPSGLVLSFLSQPSRTVMAAIDIPVLLLLAERDYMFPAARAGEELALFLGTPDKSDQVIPTAGHSFMLHRNAPVAHQIVVDWLRRRAAVIPAC